MGDLSQMRWSGLAAPSPLMLMGTLSYLRTLAVAAYKSTNNINKATVFVVALSSENCAYL